MFLRVAAEIMVLAAFNANPANSASGQEAHTTEMCRAISLQDYPPTKLLISTHTVFARDHYPRRIAEFAGNPPGCGEIVMLGDSLTERHDWNGSLKAAAIVHNRGIAGDTTDGMLVRLDEIIAAKPRAVFIMIGTNDLWSSNSAKRTAGNIEKIIATVKDGSPQTHIFVQTVLPIRSEPDRNFKVRDINAKLREMVGSHGAVLIDTYNMAVDGSGLLKAEFTDDGVHLTAAGYAAWVALLNVALAEERSALAGGDAQN